MYQKYYRKNKNKNYPTTTFNIIFIILHARYIHLELNKSLHNKQSMAFIIKQYIGNTIFCIIIYFAYSNIIYITQKNICTYRIQTDKYLAFLHYSVDEYTFYTHKLLVIHV